MMCVWRLSVAYIGPKLRTERPRKTKIGTEVAHVTRDSDTTFKVKRSKVNLQGAGAYCGGLPHSLFNTTWQSHINKNQYIEVLKKYSIIQFPDGDRWPYIQTVVGHWVAEKQTRAASRIVVSESREVRTSAREAGRYWYTQIAATSVHLLTRWTLSFTTDSATLSA